MRNHLTTVIVFTGSTLLLAADSPQTPAQLQQAMQKADEMPLASAPLGFRTPRETFQTYWEAVKRVDASEYQCLTANCLEQIFPSAPLTPLTAQDKVRIAAARQSLTERSHQLVKFNYFTDPLKPKIEFIFSLERTIDGQITPFLFIGKLLLIRTTDGWKIDSSEQAHAD